MIINCNYYNPAPVASGTLQFASSSCETIGNASDTQIFYGGDVVNSILLLLILMTLLFSFLAFKFLGVKIHKEI